MCFNKGNEVVRYVFYYNDLHTPFQLNARFDDMKINISDEKKQVDEQRRLLDEQIADFHR